MDPLQGSVCHSFSTFDGELRIQRQTQHLSCSFFCVRQGKTQRESVPIGRLKMHWNGVMNACADTTFSQKTQQSIPVLMRDDK